MPKKSAAQKEKEEEDLERSASVLLPPSPPVPLGRTAQVDDLPFDHPGPGPDATFIRSVERLGVLEPIKVTKHNGEYKILDGGRRVAAAREAGLATIATHEVDAQQWPSVDLLTLVLNEKRSGNPAAQMLAVEKLLAQGANEHAIARAAGISITKVRRLIQMSNLTPELRKALDDDMVKPAVAVLASKMPPEGQEVLEDLLVEYGKLTPRNVSQVAQQLGIPDPVKRIPKAEINLEKSDATPLQMRRAAAIRARQALELAQKSNASKELQDLMGAIISQLEDSGEDPELASTEE